MKKGILKTIFFLILGILFLIGYYFFYSKTGIGIECPFHLVTGFYCPGCGLTRMLFALVHFDIPKAFGYNQVLFVMLPFLLFYFFYQIYLFIYARKDKIFTKIPNYIYVILVIIMIIWGIVRNLPMFPYLRP